MPSRAITACQMLKPHIASLQHQHGAQRLAAAPMMGAMDTAVTDADAPAASATDDAALEHTSPAEEEEDAEARRR